MQILHKYLRVLFLLLLWLVVSTLFTALSPRGALHVSPSSSSQQGSFSQSSRTINPNVKEAAYSLALSRFWSRVNATTATDNHPYYTDLHSQNQAIHHNSSSSSSKLINCIRIPKAASSSLSIIARALAGCHPDGYPCCPQPGLMCPRVTGCTGHKPNYNGDEPIITSFRDIESRSISAFFYTPPHTTLKKGEVHSWDTFVTYVQNSERRNVLTKMLNGVYAYSPFDEERHTIANAMKRLCSFVWFGMNEMPVVSSLLLYEMEEFQWLLPNPVVFGLPPKGGLSHSILTKCDRRVNNGTKYKEFQRNDFLIHNGTSFVMEYNRQDMEVYQFAKKLFCVRLFIISGLVEDMERMGLGDEEVEKCRKVVGGSDMVGEKEALCPVVSGGMEMRKL